MTSRSFDQYLRLSPEEQARQDDLYWKRLTDPQYVAYLARLLRTTLLAMERSHTIQRLIRLSNATCTIEAEVQLLRLPERLTTFSICLFANQACRMRHTANAGGNRLSEHLKTRSTTALCFAPLLLHPPLSGGLFFTAALNYAERSHSGAGSEKFEKDYPIEIICSSQSGRLRSILLKVTHRDIHALGETPPDGVIPSRMYASVIRRERYGEPLTAFQIEQVPVPLPKSNQVLVWVMAAGVNYNNVWVALGRPIDVIERRLQKGATEPYHIGGSDAAGIVWAIGDRVREVQPGDHVVLSCGMWDESSPEIQAGADPIMSSSARIWGFEENWGSFAQFTLVEDYQCHPKPPHLSWAEAAAYMLVGATAWRMLHGWPPNTIESGQPVLIWGGAGGLGSMAIQIVREADGIPVAVVSDTEKFQVCANLGAKGVIDRTQFKHWGRLPDLNDTSAFKDWLKGARAFVAEFHRVLGTNCSPKIVFEHPGMATLPTSIFICDNGGMVVTCAGTSGYNADVDLRYLWMRQKRFQGSHFANTSQCRQFNEMICSKRIDPALSAVFTFDQIGECHQMMFENRHPPGNMAVLVNARDRDEGRSA